MSTETDDIDDGVNEELTGYTWTDSTVSQEQLAEILGAEPDRVSSPICTCSGAWVAEYDEPGNFTCWRWYRDADLEE